MISQLKKLSQTKSDLVFDFDKTIAQIEIDWTDWHVGISQVYSKFDENHGYELGKNPHEYYNTLVTIHGEDLVEDVKQFVAEYEQKYLVGFTPYPELVEFIKSNQSHNFYIYSTNARVSVEAGLKALGLSEHFKQLITRDDVSKVKPDPQGFYLLDGFEVNKDKYLMIGDSDADQLAAKSAGIDFLKCTFFGTYVFSK